MKILSEIFLNKKLKFLNEMKSCHGNEIQESILDIVLYTNMTVFFLEKDQLQIWYLNEIVVTYNKQTKHFVKISWKKINKNFCSLVTPFTMLY